jgi:hypothetical protein
MSTLSEKRPMVAASPIAPTPASPSFSSPTITATWTVTVPAAAVRTRGHENVKYSLIRDALNRKRIG